MKQVVQDHRMPKWQRPALLLPEPDILFLTKFIPSVLTA